MAVKATNNLDNAGLAIGALSCVMLVVSILSACVTLTEDPLSHKAVECVYPDGVEVCKETDNASVPVQVATP